MKRTQIKDTLRNIVRQGVSYLSIVVIAFLGVTTFLGVDYSTRALRQNGSEMYNRQNFRDIEMVSTLLFTQEDLEAIRQTEGVADAEAVWQSAGRVSAGEARQNVNVISLTERINLPRVEEGSLPASAAECAVEQHLAEEMGWHVGDRVEVETASGVGQYLSGGTFVITGIVNHPDHTNLSVPETPYILVTKDAFDQTALDGCFMKAEVVIEKAAGVNRISREYDDTVAVVYGRLNELAESRSSERSETLRDVYQRQIDESQARLDEARGQLEDAREELDEGWRELAEGERELQDGRERLEQSKTELEEAWAKLEDAQKQLNEAKAKLDAGEPELTEAKTRLDASEKEIRAAETEINQAAAQLTSGWNQLEDAKATLRNGMRSAIEDAYGGDTSGQIRWASRRSVDLNSTSVTAMDFWITETYRADLNRPMANNITSFVYSDEIPDEVLMRCYENKTGSMDGYNPSSARGILAGAAIAASEQYESDYDQLASSCRQWDEGHAEYLSGLSTYRSGLSRFQAAQAEYDAAARQYRDGQAAYETGLADYDAGMAAYEEGTAQYEQGVIDLADGEKRLEESRKQLEDGELDYEAGLAEYEDGEEQLDLARDRLAGQEECRWLLLDVHGSASFAQLIIGSGNLASLETTFSLLFILVGALVIFATVSKMIDEQRNLVGTTKALGFFNREIFAKYLAFGVSATVLGTVLGILTARFVMERFVLGGFDNYFVFDLTKPALYAVPTLLVLLAGILLSVGATWVACTRLLRAPAVRLMQPKVPEGAKKAGGGKHVLSLYSRLILLNMRADLRRVIVTVVSVAGCCALVVIGFTLKSAVNGSMERQYAVVSDYDMRVTFDPEVKGSAREIGRKLEEAGAAYTMLYDANITYRITDNQVGELYCGDLESIESFYHLRDWKTGEPLRATDEGILIQRRLAEIYGLDIGSEFEIAIGGTKTATVRVAGIFEHFIGRPMFMSPAYYKTAFQETCPVNACLVRLNGADAGKVESALKAVDGFDSCTPVDKDRAFFEASTSVINTLVALFIFMAAVMAGVVLMNLTNMYVLQKKRELTIMRINGFSVGEVIGYMIRETVLTTSLGILLGLAVGSGIAYKIIRSMEQAFFQFDRRISFFAWLMGAAITIVFTVIINVLALRRVKNLKLTDVA